jgi:phosphoribosylformylglycinamidine synthase I
MKPKVYILYAPGNNCHHETAHAFKMAGASPEIVHLTDDLIGRKIKITDCDIMAIPGGFAFGDHLAAGRIFALDLVYRLQDALIDLREKRVPILGICNGFQVLVNTGLLPDNQIGRPVCILDRNRSAVFESRWVTLRVNKTNCIWTQGLENSTLHVPVAHGEGRLRVAEPFPDDQTVLQYHRDEYPWNPNGSPGNRAGICDSSGTILGLMPHPERAIYSWNESQDGLNIFRQGVNAVR